MNKVNLVWTVLDYEKHIMILILDSGAKLAPHYIEK
jgi:hypothetical protein